MATSCLSDFLSISNDVYSPYSTPQLVWYFRLRRYDHVSDALAILQGLRLPQRDNFKLALIAYRVLNGNGATVSEPTRSGN